MPRSSALTAALCLVFLSAPVLAQEAAPAGTDKTVETVKDETGKIASETKESVDKIARQVDQDPRAKDASAGLLTFVYKIAERLSFPAFHWAAFALMVAGVVSYAFQLVLGKLALLLRGSLNMAEILSDAKALLISVVGLVLTTQAAAENSTFTQSPFAVLSSAAVGAVIGLLFYRWGQRQEVDAAIGRARPVVVKT
jgi:hypothetical protein